MTSTGNFLYYMLVLFDFKIMYGVFQFSKDLVCQLLVKLTHWLYFDFQIVLQKIAVNIMYLIRGNQV